MHLLRRDRGDGRGDRGAAARVGGRVRGGGGAGKEERC